MNHTESIKIFRAVTRGNNFPTSHSIIKWCGAPFTYDTNPSNFYSAISSFVIVHSIYKSYLLKVILKKYVKGVSVHNRKEKCNCIYQYSDYFYKPNKLLSMHIDK